MKIASVICEYNPFHFGHKYQLDILKKDFDAVVCIMSGSFVQRGDVAIFDKWTRTKAALLSGADVVIELPVRYSLSSAKGFAEGAVLIADSLGIIDSLSFGSECNDISALVNASKILNNEPEEVSEKIKNLVSSGENYAKARSEAFSKYISSDLLSLPNNILGLEYISALLRMNSTIQPITHKRTADYHSESASGEFASASFLRKMIREGKSISEFSPYDFSNSEKYDINRLSDIFKYKMITEGTDAFSGIADIEVGLAERFVKSAHLSTLADICDAVKTKRYTSSRIRRVAISAILNIKGGYKNPEYVRILGMSKVGMSVLSEMKTACRLPIVNKVADFKESSISEDITATNIASLCANRPLPQNRDLTTSPVIIKA